MEAQKTARELFTEAVRAVLETWPVLQVGEYFIYQTLYIRAQALMV